MTSPCRHLSEIRKVKPSAKGCEECLAMGDTWVHLRLCLTCGHVGCCDSSKNRHATKHFHATKHPIVQSFEPGEDWKWCYIDRRWSDDARRGMAGVAARGMAIDARHAAHVDPDRGQSAPRARAAGESLVASSAVR